MNLCPCRGRGSVDEPPRNTWNICHAHGFTWCWRQFPCRHGATRPRSRVCEDSGMLRESVSFWPIHVWTLITGSALIVVVHPEGLEFYLSEVVAVVRPVNVVLCLNEALVSLPLRLSRTHGFLTSSPFYWSEEDPDNIIERPQRCF